MQRKSYESATAEVPSSEHMPINKNDVDKGRSDEPIITQIQKFPESNKDKAFTEEEIKGHLYPDHIAWPSDTIAFSSAMLILSIRIKDRIKIYQYQLRDKGLL